MRAEWVHGDLGKLRPRDMVIENALSMALYDMLSQQTSLSSVNV